MVQIKEGGLGLPERHPLRWKNDDFYDEENLDQELRRVFDVCHGCRRCVSLCRSFPTLFDLIDASADFEVTGVDSSDFPAVVNQCFLCDLCFMTKCPYVPPHEWAIDFPQLMLRAKVVKHKKKRPGLRDRMLSSPGQFGTVATLPLVGAAVRASMTNKYVRKGLHRWFGVHEKSYLGNFQKKKTREILPHCSASEAAAISDGETQGKVVLFISCYANVCESSLAEDLVAVFEHNNISWALPDKDVCCGMPKLELGDLPEVEKLKDRHVRLFQKFLDQGYDIVTPVSSCVLMFKQTYPSLFPSDEQVQKMARHVFDPCEYLMKRHKSGLLNTHFKHELGKVAYHAACHTRVQNVGLKSRDLLRLVPNTEIALIERCSGHDGTYAVKVETRDNARKTGLPAALALDKAKAQHLVSDCFLAASHISELSKGGLPPRHPLSLMRKAYGI